MITLTESAIKEIKELLVRENKEDHFIRVGIKGGGCSGFMYELDFDNEKTDNDQEFDFDGVKVLVDNKSMIYLSGTELEFADGLQGSGFVFLNPNVTRTCGCGDSFAV